MAIGHDGWAHFAAWSGGWMGLYRSSGGGTQWTDQELESYDRPWLSVSPTGSKIEGSLYLHGSGEPEASEGDMADVTLFRADEHGMRFRSTAGLDLAREDRKVLTTGDSVVLPDGRVVVPYLVRLVDPSVYESKTLAPP
jgi:hypothetical protein